MKRIILVPMSRKPIFRSNRTFAYHMNMDLLVDLTKTPIFPWVKILWFTWVKTLWVELLLSQWVQNLTYQLPEKLRPFGLWVKRHLVLSDNYCFGGKVRDDFNDEYKGDNMNNVVWGKERAFTDTCLDKAESEDKLSEGID